MVPSVKLSPKLSPRALDGARDSSGYSSDAPKGFSAFKPTKRSGSPPPAPASHVRRLTESELVSPSAFRSVAGGLAADGLSRSPR
jgi:hypothetical protein